MQNTSHKNTEYNMNHCTSELKRRRISLTAVLINKYSFVQWYAVVVWCNCAVLMAVVGQVTLTACQIQLSIA